MEQSELKENGSGLLEAIKDEVARDSGYKDWNTLTECESAKTVSHVMEQVARRYAASHALAVGEAVKKAVSDKVGLDLGNGRKAKSHLATDDMREEYGITIDYDALNSLSVQDIINSLNK